MLNGRKLVDIGANLTTSRLVSLGFLAEAVERNITTYQVSEVLDERTCPVCRQMHGKTFQVAHEHSRLMTVLGTSDPKELRNIAPWPRQNKAGLDALRGMSSEEMQAAGFGSPPYHPMCRGLLVLNGNVTEATVMRPPKVRTVEEQPAEDPLQHFMRLMETHKPKLDKNDVEVVDRYVGNQYSSMNLALRRGHGQDRELKRYLKKEIKRMDRAVAKSPLPEDVTVYRGVKDVYRTFDVEDLSQLKGMTFLDKGFLSTSGDIEVASDFSWKVKGALFEIKVPKGTHGVIPEAIEGVLTGAEREIVLERGLSLHVTKVDLSQELPKIYATVVGKAQKADAVAATNLVKAEGGNRFVWEPGDLITQW